MKRTLRLALMALLAFAAGAGVVAQQVDIPRDVRQQLRVAHIPFHARLGAYLRHFNAPFLEDPDRKQTLMIDEAEKLGLQLAEMERFVTILGSFNSAYRIDANIPYRETCEALAQGKVFANAEAKTIVANINRNGEAVKTAKAAAVLDDVASAFGATVARATEARITQWGTAMTDEESDEEEMVSRLFGGDYYRYLQTTCGIP